MSETKNEVAKSFSESLTDKLVAVKGALPSDFNIQRFVQNSMAVLNGKPELQKCNKASLLNALLQASYMGFDLANKDGYIIAYGNEAQLQSSYFGEIKFVTRYSHKPVSNIFAEIIREKDEFKRWTDDVGQHYTFSQNGIDGNIVGAFAVCHFADGTIQIEVMSTDEINSVRNNYSKASQSKAWKNSWSEMAKKTVLRRLTKHIPTDFDSTEAQLAWEKVGGSEFSDSRSGIDTNDIPNPFGKPKAEDTEEVINVEAEEIIEDATE